jgi:hypothetical protein
MIWGSNPDKEKGFFSAPRCCSVRFWLNESPIQWIIVTLSPEVNRPGRETDHVQLLPRLEINKAKSTFASEWLQGWKKTSSSYSSDFGATIYYSSP